MSDNPFPNPWNEIDRLRAVNAALVEALGEAREMVAEWGAYASPYFQEKWNLDGDIAKLDAALALAKGEKT